MLSNTLSEIFERDLNKLKTEVSSYKDEKNMWLIEESISNSGGNLCLHLLGNLNYFVGNILGNTGYVRERDKEFTDKNVPRAELIACIEKLIEVVKQTIVKLSDEDMNKIYPQNIFPKDMTTEHFLIIMMSHFNYHLGQINYHRRLLDQS